MDAAAERVWEVEQVYRSRLPELWRVAAAVSGSRDAAPDLVQEAFVRAVRRIDSFRGDGPIEAWLWRIVVNVARNAQREPEIVALTQELPVRDGSSADDAQGELATAMSRLSERQRLVVFLRNSFGSDNVLSPRGQNPHAIPGQAKKITTLRFKVRGGRTRLSTLHVTPTKSGGFCYGWTGVAGGCVSAKTLRRPRPLRGSALSMRRELNVNLEGLRRAIREVPVRSG